MIELLVAAGTASTASHSGWSTAAIVLGVIGSVLTILTILSAAIVVVLRSSKNEIISDQEKMISMLRDERTDCDEKVAQLSGRISVLEGDFVERLVTMFATALATHMAVIDDQLANVRKRPPRV